MKLEANHLILAKRPDLETATNQALRFLDKTQLVRYDQVQADERLSVSAEDNGFWQKLEQGIDANRETLAELAGELKHAGFDLIRDLVNLPQGFQSKTLHTMTHLLDGFFGIDSAFYNIIDDSHWLSAPLKENILARPSGFWLIDVTGTIKVVSSKKAVLLRSFE